MANLKYKVEYLKDDKKLGDEGALLHVTPDVGTYRSYVTREEYMCMDPDLQSAFMDSIFAVEGVVAAASQANRIFIEKSPIFTWDEVVTPVLEAARVMTSTLDVEELPGSGVNLGDTKNRRSPEFGNSGICTSS
jgi:hypothetical protein